MRVCDPVSKSGLWFSTCAVVVFGLSTTAYAQQATEEQKGALANYPKGWVKGMQHQAAEYIQYASICYSLDEGQIGLLTSELERRILDQWTYMSNPPEEIVELQTKTTEDLNGDGGKDFAARYDKFYRGMPMNPAQVSTWIEDNLITQEQRGSDNLTRFNELLFRTNQRNEAKITDAEDSVALSKQLRLDLNSRLVIMGDNGIEWSRVMPISVGPTSSVFVNHQNTRFVSDRPRVEQSGNGKTPSSTFEMPPPLPVVRDFEAIVSNGSLNDGIGHELDIDLWKDINWRCWRIVAAKSPSFFDKLAAMTSNELVMEQIKENGLEEQFDAIIHEFNCRMVRYRDN